MYHVSKKIKTLETDLNTDLKATSEWLKANRLSLNVKKSQLLIFHSKFKKIDINLIEKLVEGIKLIPSKYVKYLGFFIHCIFISINTFPIPRFLPFLQM